MLGHVLPQLLLEQPVASEPFLAQWKKKKISLDINLRIGIAEMPCSAAHLASTLLVDTRSRREG